MPDKRCPECNSSVLTTLQHAMAVLPERQRPQMQKVIDSAYAGAADRCGFAIDCVQFVLDACAITSKKRSEVSAKQICLAVADYAHEHFGDDARTAFDTWNVRTAEDIGKVIFAAVDEDLIEPSVGDSIDDFAGIGTIGQLLADGA